MICITGDTHGGFQRFGNKYFPQQREMSRDDYMIISGDFGGVWDGSAEENYWLNWLEDKPWTTLWVDGNHENFDMLKRLPVEEWKNGRVQRIRPHILRLLRGQAYEIDGLTFFTMGGASSHDIQDGILDPSAPDFEREYWWKRRTRQRFRVLGHSWWPDELPSDEEYLTALATLERIGWRADCVITHCAPSRIVRRLNPDYTTDRLNDFLDMVDQRLEFQYWFFGHYHDNQAVDDRHILLWEQIVQLL